MLALVKRIFLFLITNLAVILVLSVTLTILSKVFGVEYATIFTGSNYLPLLVFALVVGFTGSFLSLLISKFVAKWSYKIDIIDSQNLGNYSSKERFIFDVVSRLAMQNNIKMPEVGIYESPEPNAFATGPTKNNSLIAVSTGLLDKMDENEIEGVLGHEVSHIANGDMVTMVLIQGVINTFVIFISRMLARFIEKVVLKSEESGTWVYGFVTVILEILLGVLATMIVMKFSRYREYRADEGSSLLVGKEKMIAALKKLKYLQDFMLTGDSDRFATMKISSKKKSGILRLFSSHPDLDDRIRNLELKSF